MSTIYICNYVINQQLTKNRFLSHCYEHHFKKKRDEGLFL